MDFDSNFFFSGFIFGALGVLVWISGVGSSVIGRDWALVFGNRWALGFVGVGSWGGGLVFRE